jgi:hypothetical protein
VTNWKLVLALSLLALALAASEWWEAHKKARKR